MSADQLFDENLNPLHNGTIIGMVRNGDGATAQMAAVHAFINRSDGKKKALDCLYRAGARGLNDFEHLAMGGQHQTSAGKRRKDLEDEGYVRKLIDDETGELVFRPSTTTGDASQVYCLTALGYGAAVFVQAGLEAES